MTLDMKSEVWRRREFRAVERRLDPVPGADAAYFAHRRGSIVIFTFRYREGVQQNQYSKSLFDIQQFSNFNKNTAVPRFLCDKPSHAGQLNHYEGVQKIWCQFARKARE